MVQLAKPITIEPEPTPTPTPTATATEPTSVPTSTNRTTADPANVVKPLIVPQADITEIMLHRMFIALNRRKPDYDKIFQYLKYYYGYWNGRDAKVLTPPEVWLSAADFNRWMDMFDRCAIGSVSKEGHPLGLSVVLYRPMEDVFADRLDQLSEQVDWDAEDRKKKSHTYNRNRSNRVKGIMSEADIAYQVYMDACRRRKEIKAIEDAKVKEAWAKYEQLRQEGR